MSRYIIKDLNLSEELTYIGIVKVNSSNFI